MSTPTQPTFLIIGAAKAATTTLAGKLRDPPDVTFSKVKETHFFSLQQQYGRGWDWYLSLFDHHENQTAIGEASTSYSRIRSHPRVVKRIAQHLPDVKIIYMVRHPLDRIRSAWLEWLATAHYDETMLSLSQAVQQMPVMVDSSRHFEVFDAYRQRFGEDQIKVVWFEEFASAQKAVFDDICNFLGIDKVSHRVSIESDRNDQAQVIERLEALGRSVEGLDLDWTPSARAFVLDELRSDMERFLEHFERPSDYWAM